MFVDTCYKLKTFKGKTNCAKCSNAKLFCDLHAKLHAILTAGRQAIRFEVGRGCTSAERQRRQRSQNRVFWYQTTLFSCLQLFINGI